MMTAEAKTEPNREAIEQHIHMLSKRWGELDQPAMMEIRALDPDEPSRNKFARFDVLDDQWRADAVDYAAAMNAANLNVYITVNPLRADIPAGSAATDADVIGAFFSFIDCDTEEATEQYKGMEVAPKRAFNVLTGTVPFNRPHIYWELNEPQKDMQAWRELQIRLAARFKSDGVVVNPSRIMRLAGTVNRPGEKKRAIGRIDELTTLGIKVQGEPVLFDRMMSLFPATGTPAPGQSDSSFQFDTGPEAMNRALAAANIQAGEEWHNNVIKLIASYVAKGLADAEIHAITDGFTQAGYTVDQTRAEVQKAIDGARAKGFAPQEAPEPTFDDSGAQKTEEGSSEQTDIAPFAPWKPFDLATIPAVKFAYSDFYARGYTSLTIAPPKVGKSMLGLAEAIDMATGRGFLTGVEREPLKVVYFNAEDDQDVLNARVAALLTHYGIDQQEIAGRLYAQSGVDWSNFHFAHGDEGVLSETIFKMIEAFIDQEKPDVLIFDPLQDMSDAPETNDVFRRIGRRLRKMASSKNVALGLIHHTRKIAPGAEISMEDARGGSALRGTARFNRALSPMTEEEGVKAGLADHRFYMRIADVEGNLMPPSSERNRWFEKASVETPNGERVGAIKRWEWPDAFDGVTREDAARVRALVDREEEPLKADIRAKRWVGKLVAETLGMNLSNKADTARVKTIISEWLKTDVLRVAEHHDSRAGRTVDIIVCGANNPISEASA